VLVSVIFFCLFGMGIAYFAAGSSLLWLMIGAAAGAVAGYFFGHQIDKALSKK
jgi:ABC-type dipeptide/oligopeptide/nickel transport system permease subunit